VTTTKQKKEKKKTTRLNLDVSPKVIERLENLKKIGDSSSIVEVIRRALALYEFVLEGKCKVMKPKPEGGYIEVAVLGA
jgi:hypothetical protein